MNFAYTAMDATGRRITDSLDCANAAEAQRLLGDKGLFVLRLDAGRGKRMGGNHQAEIDMAGRSWRARVRSLAGGNGREVALFAQQMSMMLQAGSPMVPAIQAVATQARRPDWRRVLDQLAGMVEGGTSLHEAMEVQNRFFSSTVRSLIAAGEATGTLPHCFQRLSLMLDAQQRARAKVLAALIYPALLLVMALSVLVTMTFFVLPRFADLFEMLGAELPLMTSVLLDVARILRHWWPLAIVVPVVLALGVWAWVQFAGGKLVILRAALLMPGIGRAVRGIVLAKFLRVWGMLLTSHVPVLDALRHARESTQMPAFQRLFDELTEAVTGGQPAGAVLRTSGLVPATVAAAISTGEDSGRMGEAMEFVAGWLEEQNDNLIGTLTRVFEPLILLLMGAVVGLVCISLFLPLFDVATAA